MFGVLCEVCAEEGLLRGRREREKERERDVWKMCGLGGGERQNLYPPV